MTSSKVPQIELQSCRENDNILTQYADSKIPPIYKVDNYNRVKSELYLDKDLIYLVIAIFPHSHTVAFFTGVPKVIFSCDALAD